MTPTDYWILAALLLAAGIVWLVRRRPSGRIRYSGQLKRGQNKAVSTLEEQGFTLVGSGAEVPVKMQVDGRTYEELARADLAVRRSGRTYLVLTGSDLRQGRLNSQRRRQQLMSLAWAFRPHGFLIYNPEKDSWREVRLDVPGIPGWIAPALLGVVVGAVFAIKVLA